MGEIHVHVHPPPGIEDKLHIISDKLDEVLEVLGNTNRSQRRIMATQQELLQELSEINATTNELSDDVDALILKADNPAEKEAVKAELVSLKGKLQSIASKYTPDVPPVDTTDPNVTGRARR